jgi:hypothetical protein
MSPDRGLAAAFERARRIQEAAARTVRAIERRQLDTDKLDRDQLRSAMGASIAEGSGMAQR